MNRIGVMPGHTGAQPSQEVPQLSNNDFSGRYLPAPEAARLLGLSAATLASTACMAPARPIESSEAASSMPLMS